MRTAFVAQTTFYLLLMNLFGVPWYVVVAILAAFGAGYVFNAGEALYVRG